MRQYGKRIETFAKNIDETGKFLFQVQLPKFDIDDTLRVESRFGDVTRCTSATWQNGNEKVWSSATDMPIQDELSINNVQSSETEVSQVDNTDDVINNTNDEIEELSDQIDEPVSI